MIDRLIRDGAWCVTCGHAAVYFSVAGGAFCREHWKGAIQLCNVCQDPIQECHPLDHCTKPLRRRIDELQAQKESWIRSIQEANREAQVLVRSLEDEVDRLRRELWRIRDADLSYAAMKTVALEALLPPEERG